jgi:hypothetical protein
LLYRHVAHHRAGGDSSSGGGGLGGGRLCLCGQPDFNPVFIRENFSGARRVLRGEHANLERWFGRRRRRAEIAGRRALHKNLGTRWRRLHRQPLVTRGQQRPHAEASEARRIFPCCFECREPQPLNQILGLIHHASFGEHCIDVVLYLFQILPGPETAVLGC